MLLGAVLTTVLVAVCACMLWDVGNATATRLQRKKKTKIGGSEKDASL
eukprot:COSAG03_NODE_1201_length_4575_cov_1.650581_2_plen_48_part_00